MYKTALTKYKKWLTRHVSLTIPTRKCYLRQIENFLSYLEQHEIPSLNSVPIKKLISFIYYRNNVRYSDSWVRVRIASLELFFRWAFEFRFCSEHHMVNLKKSKIVIKPLTESSKKETESFVILSEQEQKRLLKSIIPSNNLDFINVRNRCIITLLLGSGLFAEEIIALQLEDLNLKKGYVFSQVNPLRMRKISLDLKVCKRACIKWLSLRKKLIGDIDLPFIFINVELLPISKRTLYNIVSEALSLADIHTKRSGPEVLRQTALCNRIRSGHSFEKLCIEFGIKTLNHIELYRKQIIND